MTMYGMICGASGNGNSKGLIYHVGAPKPNGGWMVFDVWESAEAFQEFGKNLMPLIQKNNKKACSAFCIRGA